MWRISLRHPRLLSATLGVAVICTFPPGIHGQDTSDGEVHTIAKIKQAWQERADKIRTAKFAWTREQFMPKQSIDPNLFSALRRRGAEIPMSTSDMRGTATQLVAFDGVKFRYEFDGAELGLSGVSKRKEINTNDTTTNASLTEFDNQDFHQGAIYRLERVTSMGNVQVKPIAYTVRPFVRNIGGLDLTGFQVAEQSAEYSEDEQCVVIRRQSRGTHDEMWLSPQQGYSIRRYVMHKPDGTFMQQTDIAYEYDAEADVWAPASWAIVSDILRKNKPRTTTARVTSRELNKPIPASDFRITFPEGTLISDMTEPGVGTYIQRADGSRRRVTDAEHAAGLRYDDLVDTETGELLARQLGEPSWLTFAVVGGLAAVIIAAAGWLLFRRRLARANAIIAIGLATVFSLSTANTSLAQTNDDAEHTIAKIKQAWQERADKIRTAKFEWTQEHFTPRNAIDPNAVPVLRRRGIDTPMPASDMSATSKLLVAFDGVKFRYEFDGSRLGLSGAVKRNEINAYDANTNASLRNSGGLSFPEGIIYNPERITSMGDVQVKPIAYALRPFVRNIGGLDLSKFAISDQDVEYSPGQRCVLLRQPVTGRRAELWLDPGQGYSLRRFAVHEGNGGMVQQMDIEYEHDVKADVWVPASWRIVSNVTGSGNHQTTTAKVTTHELNKPMPASYFRVTFPEGTLISDMTEPGVGTYIQRADGSRREVTGSERIAGLTYDELVESETGELLARQLGNRSWLMYAICGGLIFVVVLVFCCRAWRRKRLA